MARKLAARAAAFACLALLVAPVAAGGNGGIAPPDPATPSGEAINQVYWVVFGVAAFVFVAIEGALVLFILRFRRRRNLPDDFEAPQIHGNTRLELYWTIVPALMLVGIAAFTFARIPAVEASPSREESRSGLTIRVEAHQFYWQYVYPNGVIALDLLRLPVDRTVTLELTSYDVIHSWWVPALTGKRDAVPGQVNELHFRPERTGRLSGSCGEFCGLIHARMVTEVEVLPTGEFEAWLAGEQTSQGAAETVGQTAESLGGRTWEAVCAKCHGLQGEGGFGPAIAGNGTLGDLEGLRTLLENGQNEPTLDGYMPPVGRGWPERQLAGLVAYIEGNDVLASGAPNAGGAQGAGETPTSEDSEGE